MWRIYACSPGKCTCSRASPSLHLILQKLYSSKNRNSELKKRYPYWDTEIIDCASQHNLPRCNPYGINSQINAGLIIFLQTKYKNLQQIHDMIIIYWSKTFGESISTMHHFLAPRVNLNATIVTFCRWHNRVCKCQYTRRGNSHRTGHSARTANNTGSHVGNLIHWGMWSTRCLNYLRKCLSHHL